MSNKVYFFLILFLLSSATVCAVGIGQYSREKLILFQPGLEKKYTFYLYDAPHIRGNVLGELAQYTTVIDADPDGGARNIDLVIKLPDYLEPGIHSLTISATESISGETGSAGAYTSVETHIKVFALYPGKHPDFNEVVANDLNTGEKSVLGLSVTNNGEETVTGASGKITIYDVNNLTVAILNADTKSIGPFETQSLNTVLDAAMYNLTPGKYRAVGTVTYDGLELNYTKESTFIVGSMNLNIVDSTPDIYVNATNKYYMTIESDWAANIDNVYATIRMPDGETVKTPNIDLIKPEQGRKAAGQLEAYLETKGLEVGTYNLDVTLYYKGNTDTKKVKVNIIEGEAPKIDKPKTGINSTTVLIIISVILAIFVAVYFLVIRKGKVNSSTSNSPGNDKSFSDKDIKPPSL